ncbi:MAG: hypothetical protein AAGA77_09110 [Bacteroidota bacterium]
MNFTKAITVLLVGSFFLFSCGGDDKNGLEGEWEAVSFQAEVSSSTAIEGVAFVSSTIIEGSNLDYVLNLDDGDYTVSGSYDLTVTTGSDLIEEPIVDGQSYSGVSGEGTYSLDEDEITVMGQFFEFDLDGAPIGQSAGTAVAKYTLNGDMLSFSQMEETMIDFGGSISTTTIEATSTWRRK